MAALGRRAHVSVRTGDKHGNHLLPTDLVLQWADWRALINFGDNRLLHLCDHNPTWVIGDEFGDNVVLRGVDVDQLSRD